MEPSVEKAYKIEQIGKCFIARGAAMSLETLCYSGLAMSNETGVVEKAVVWPQHVKDKIHSACMHLAGNVGLTALSALSVAISLVLMIHDERLFGDSWCNYYSHDLS